MDFHGMKRKDLQTLCKKHGVPANLTNREMVDQLASIYKEDEEPISLEKLSTNPKEIGSDNEAKVVKKQAKKVSFNPENQTIEYEVSVCLQPRKRSRKLLLSKNPVQDIENAPNSEDIRKVEDCQVRITRSRVRNAVEDNINMVFSPPVGRKRSKGGMKNRDAEVNNIGKSEALEMGEREDVKNGHHEVTDGFCGRQLRSMKNVTQEESKKRKGKGGDEVHSFDEISEESDVVREDANSKNGRRQPTRNARKDDRSVKLSSEVEKVEVVSRVTRQSRAKPKDIASMVKSEVKTVGVQRGCEDVIQLKEPQKDTGKNALRENAVHQRVSAESSLIGVGGAATEKPLRRSKRNAEKDCAKSTTSVRSETQVTKVQEQSERHIALEEPPECLRRYSSRRKSVLSQSGKGENNEEFLKKETKKRSRTIELDAVVENGGEIERAKYAFTLQDQAPFRRSRRKTVILNAPAVADAKLANKEDIEKMQQLRVPYLGKEVTEELPRKSSQNSSGCSLSGTCKEDQNAVAKKDQGVKQQMQEPSLEEEKTSVVELHAITEKPQRRSNRISSIRASFAPCNPTAKVVEKRQPSKSRMEIIEEEASLTKSLPAGKDELLVAEGSGNKNDLDLNFGKQAVKNADGCSNKKGKGLRGNSGAKKQCGFVEASPLFLDTEESKDSAGNMEETLITTSENLVGLSTDQEIQHFAHKSMGLEEKENNLLGDDRERLVHGGNVESEVNSMPSQSVNTTCVLDDANCLDPKLLEFEGNVSHVLGSSEINFPAESQGRRISDQEMKEDTTPIDTHSAHESLVVDNEYRSILKIDKQRLVHVDSTDNEMNLPQSSTSLNGRGAVDDSNLLESRWVEFETKLVNMDSSEITSPSNGLSLADQKDLTGATSTLLNSEKDLETELPRGEDTNFLSDNVNVDDSRAPFGEDHILAELKDTNFTAAESVTEAIFKDPLNEYGEISSLKSGSQNTLKKAEVIATEFSKREGIPPMESSFKATENEESSAEFHFATAETGAQNIIEIQESSYINTAAPGTPCEPAPGNQFEDKICRVDAANAAGRGMSDQERNENLNPGNAHFIHEAVLIYEENTRVVKNDEEIRIHDDTSEGEMKYYSCLSLNGTGTIDDSILVEPRMVDFESYDSKVVSPEIASLANVFSPASQVDLAGKTSSYIELEKVLETGEPSENMNSIYCNVDAEGSETTIEEDQILKDANLTAPDSIGDVIFSALPNEPDENIGLKRGSEIPLKKSEKLSATEFSDGEEIALTESSIKAPGKHEFRAQIDIVNSITGTPNITEIKWSSTSGTATCEALFGSAPQSQDKLCSAGLTVCIARSEICNQDEETSLVEDDKEILIQDDTIEGEIKYQPCLSLNKTGALDDALIEPRMVELESNANKVICSEMTSLADVCSLASQANFAGETSNELKVEKLLESESPRSGNVNYESDKIEVEDDKSSPQEDQNSMHLEDANTIAAESVQEVFSWDYSNKFCESCVTKEFEVSLKKAEELSTDNSSGKGMVQTEGSVDFNEKSEATAKIHTLTAEAGEKTISEIQWSVSSHDTTLISPLRPKVGSQDLQGTIYRVETAVSHAGYGMCGQQKNEENVKIVENEHDETINAKKELFSSGKKYLEESFEGKVPVGGVCRRLSDSTHSQCIKDKKVDISDESFNNVSCETEEKYICEALDEEGTDPISSEEKDNDVFKSASHADASPQRICNEKLSFNGCLPVSNDMEGKSEAVYMDNKNMRNEIQVYFLPQLALELLDNESEAAKQGAENGEANATVISNVTQALPSEELTAPIISEPFSMKPHDHVLVGGERNSSGERVMDHPFDKDFAATMDSNGISASREADVGQDDNIMEEIATPFLKVVLADHSGHKVVSTEFSEEMPNASVGTRLSFLQANCSDLDDQGEKVALECDCSSSIGLDGLKSTVGIIMGNVLKVGTVESTLNSKDPQCGKKVDDPDVNDSNAADEFDAAFTVEEAEIENCGKAHVSHQRSLFGDEQEDVPSYADKPCCKPEISIGCSTLLCSSIPVSCEKELHPQVMDDINDVGGAEISIDCKVTREERDGCQIASGGFSGVTDGSLVERSKGELEEIAEAKSDGYEGSVKTATFIDSTNSLVVNQPLCLDESKSCDLETVEPHGLHLHAKIVGDSREVGSCNELDNVSSICAASDEHKDLENPDESHILTSMAMCLFLEGEDDVKKLDANASDSNHSDLDKAITKCNSSSLKGEDYIASADVEDINFSVKMDDPEDIEETMELRKDVSGLVAAVADKCPLLKNSEVGRVVDGEEAFRSELNLLSSQKKNVTAKKKGSNSAFVKQLTSSVIKCKSKPSVIQRTPKRLIIRDTKENEGSTKRIGNRTTHKTSSKRRPLEPVWKY
ncbi:uncharacterized protein LOC111315162 [Durio zibethinus]|uniref:Uncharacterized protein LOC111315162 n=1 Tax=Durio zibethinus TaxID=66656 RepID=A0A6P6B6G4_DURZI|nr:uncharacterized protein LOC111315162 [Durio zibethinus]